MKGRRVRIVVEVNLDAVPGWGYDPQDFVDLMQRQLDNSVPHYDPKVTLEDGGNSEKSQ